MSASATCTLTAQGRRRQNAVETFSAMDACDDSGLLKTFFNQSIMTA
jgi:hypothetical protein